MKNAICHPYSITCALFLLMSASGCVSRPPTWAFKSAIFPTAVFRSEGFRSASPDGIEHFTGLGREAPERRLSKDEMSFAMSFRETVCSVFGTNEVHAALSDPFARQAHGYVLFDTATFSNEIVYYMDNLFTDSGWKIIRDHCTLFEESSAGGTVVHVYSKNKCLVRLMVYGFDGDVHPPELMPHSEYELSFIGVEPKEILGSNYRLKGTETIDIDYHFFGVDLNRRKMLGIDR